MTREPAQDVKEWSSLPHLKIEMWGTPASRNEVEFDLSSQNRDEGHPDFT